MKRTLTILALFIIPFISGAQDVIEDVFKKYSGNDSFTSIVIGKDLLNLAFSLDNEKNAESLKGKISDLKILVSNNTLSKKNDSFFTDIKEALDKNSYLNLMEIRDGKSKVRIYAKKDNDTISHLVLIASEDDEEVLLSLRGLFSMKELAELGKCSNGDGSFHYLSHLKDVEKQ